jgi:hypothetical protein
MMADRNGYNGTAGNDNDLFRNTDNDPNQGGLERIAHQAADPGNRSLGSRYKENFIKNFEWTKEIGKWTGEYLVAALAISIAPYIIPTIYGEMKEASEESGGNNGNGNNRVHESAFIAGGVTGIAGWFAQLYGIGCLASRHIGTEGGRFEWEYFLIPAAINLVDYVFVEPLRKSLNEVNHGG